MSREMGRAKSTRVKDTMTENCQSLNTPYRLFGECLDNVTIYVTRHGKLQLTARKTGY
jgi:hypothetical protein